MRRSDIAILAFAALLAGCATPPKKADKPKSASGPQRVDFRGYSLGERGKTSLRPAAFGERVSTLLQAGRGYSAARYIERYPDVAAETLRAPPAGLPPDALAFLEGTHDAQCSLPNASKWDERRKAAAPLQEMMQTSLGSMKGNTVSGEKVLKLCKATDGTAAAMDGCRLAAYTHLSDNHLKEAVGELEKGLTAAAGRPYEAASLLLLYAESLRRDGQFEAGAAAWAKAVTWAATLLDRQPSIRDPQLWERLATLRQVQMKWPVEARFALMRAVRLAGLPLAEGVTDEAVLWAAVGCWWLDRNEPQAALTALKRSETMINDPSSRGLLQVWQAKALVQVDQVSTATALLVPLAENANPMVAGPALAALGAIKLQAGAVRQARGLLEKAEALPADWPGRAESLGNLALVLLMEGEDQKGIERLHSAQAAFRATGQTADLLQSLKNELDYWTERKEKARMEEARGRIERIEKTGSDFF